MDGDLQLVHALLRADGDRAVAHLLGRVGGDGEGERAIAAANGALEADPVLGRGAGPEATRRDADRAAGAVRRADGDLFGVQRQVVVVFLGWGAAGAGRGLALAGALGEGEGAFGFAVVALDGELARAFGARLIAVEADDDEARARATCGVGVHPVGAAADRPSLAGIDVEADRAAAAAHGHGCGVERDSGGGHGWLHGLRGFLRDEDVAGDGGAVAYPSPGRDHPNRCAALLGAGVGGDFHDDLARLDVGRELHPACGLGAGLGVPTVVALDVDRLLAAAGGEGEHIGAERQRRLGLRAALLRHLERDVAFIGMEDDFPFTFGARVGFDVEGTDAALFVRGSGGRYSLHPAGYRHLVQLKRLVTAELYLLLASVRFHL